MSSHEVKKVPRRKNLKDSKLSSQDVHRDSSIEPKIKKDSAKKKVKYQGDCLKSNASYTLIENEYKLENKLEMYKENFIKIQITESTRHNEETSSKRKLRNLEFNHQNIHSLFSAESPHEMMKTTSVKRLKISKSPCLNVITRSKNKTLKLKEAPFNKNTRINKTNNQDIATHSKSEIPDNLNKTEPEKKVKKSKYKHLNFSSPIKIDSPAALKKIPRKKLKHKRYCRPISPESETSSQVNGSLNQEKELQNSKLPMTESSTSEIEIIELDDSILQNDPVTSKNGTSDDLKQTENMKTVISSLSDVKQVLFEKTILRKELPTTSKISAENSETFEVPEFKADLKGPEVEFERKTDYYNLLALNDVDLVQNVEQFECPLCFTNVGAGEGAILQECLHSFCRECLANVIQISRTAVVKCPFPNVEYSCESYLQEREIKSLVTPEVYEQHLHRSLSLAESQALNSYHCKTPKCPGWCLFEDAFVNAFVCPVCNHSNCLTCAAIHEGKNCAEYLADLLVICDNIEQSGKTREYLQKEFQKAPEFETHSRDSGNKFEKKTDYHNLLALNDVNLVQNVEQFECPICFSSVDNGEGVTLQECLHSFCRECLAGAIQFSETAVVQCPFRNDEYSCESHLQEREIKSLVTSEIYEKHLQRSIALAENQAQNSFHCKTSDCPGWCLFEDAVNTFLCPVCNHTNCLTCAAIHEGRNCKQYQDDLVFKCDSVEEASKTSEYLQNILDKGKAMRCPQCQIILMKKEGCDWFKCSMCHTEICWRTKGPRWGPKGSGDVSGGCKCKVNGTLCHPQCRNCH